MNRTVLILGAGGFVGRQVTATLAASGGIRPIAVSRHADGRQPVGVESRCLDVADEKALTGALKDVDAVVNCVAARPSAMRRADRSLFAACQKIGRPLVVHLSSMAVYGDATGSIDESAPLADIQGPYAAAKLAAEQTAERYGRAVVLRPGCIYGPGGPQWSGRIARLLQSRRIGDLGAGGDGIANLVHVEDVAAAVLAALQTGAAEGQAFNLAMSGAPTWNDYFLSFAKALGAVPIRRLSERRIGFETRYLAPPLKLAEIAARRIGRSPPPPISPSLSRLWRQEIRLESGKAETLLGLRWTALSEGLAETAAWVRQQGR